MSAACLAQVYKWEISSGKKLHNYSAHTSKVVQVFPTYDATFFCAATEKEVLVWLVQAGRVSQRALLKQSVVFWCGGAE